MIKNNKELIAEIKGAVLALTDSLAYLAEGASAGKAPASKSKSKASDEEKEESGEDEDRRAELEAMSYNDLKALVSQLKGKAVGKKPELIELILELEGEGAEEEEEETPKSSKKTAKGKKVKEEEPEEDGEEGYDDEEVTEEGMREQLADFEVSELKDIAKEMGVTIKAKATKGAIITTLVKDLEKLDETLESMGYYAEDGEEGSDEEEGENLADKLAGKDLEDLATICADNGISSKGKKQALIDRIVEAVDNGDLEEADLDLDAEGEESSEEEEDGATVEEIVDELELDDLKSLAKELGITVTKTSKAVALKKAILAEDEDSVVEALESLGLAGEGEEEGEEEADEQDVEVSEDVLEAEAKVEKDLRAKIKAGKIKEPAMKKFLQEYYDGDPDCKYCNGECSKEERIECFIKIKKRFVDDECEVHDVSDPYTRGEEDFCCGKKLVAGTGKKKGTFTCEVCGEEYKFED